MQSVPLPIIGYLAVAPTPWGTGGTRSPREYKNSKQETDQTVLTITKALTKMTNCTFRAKKVEGHDNFFGALRRIGAPHPLSLRTGAPSGPHFQIRSGATVT